MKQQKSIDLFAMFKAITISGITREYIEAFLQKYWIDEYTIEITREKGKIIDAIEFVGVTKKNQEKVADMKDWLLALPLNVLQRGHLKKITLLPPVWFKKGVTMQNLGTFPGGPITENLAEAASVLSLPCGRSTLFDTGKKDNQDRSIWDVYQGEVQMFDFPWEEMKKKYTDSKDRAIIQNAWQVYEMYVFLHEVSHIYIKSPFYSEYYCDEILQQKEVKDFGYQLRLPYKKDFIGASTYLSKFEKLIRKYPGQFGEYSALYKESEKSSFWFHENIADASAALFIGFVMDQKKLPVIHDHDLSLNCVPHEVAIYLFNFWHADTKILIKQ